MKAIEVLPVPGYSQFFARMVFASLLLCLWAAAVFAEGAGRIVILGDSLTAGYGIDPSEAFPALLQKKLDQRGLAFEVVDAGVSGDTTASGLRRVAWVLKQPTRVLVLELGANDGLRGVPLESTRKNLQGIIDRAKELHPQVEVVIAGMMIPPNLGPEYAGEFRQMFEDLARENDARLIPFLLEGVAGRPEMNLGDGIHPNPEGHRIVADNVWKVLAPLLRD